MEEGGTIAAPGVAPNTRATSLSICLNLDQRLSVSSHCFLDLHSQCVWSPMINDFSAQVVANCGCHTVCLFVIAECHLALVPLPHNFITSFSRIKVSLTVERRIKLWARIDRKCGDRRVVCLNDSSPTLRKTGWYRVGCLAVVMWKVLFLR